MSSTFKFHSQVNEMVPFNATYVFPTQGTACYKQTVKIPPKNGGNFTPGNIVRIELPSDGYMNALNSVLSFDLTVTGGTNHMLQRSGAHSLIKRLRIMYGSLVLEDIQEYKTLVRIFTEAGVQQDYMTSSGTILDGMYDAMELSPAAKATSAGDYTPNTTSVSTLAGDITSKLLKSAPQAGIDLSSTVRTYCLNLMSGVLTTKKLIPLKWMAAQLSIEITLATVNDAFLQPTNSSPPSTYTLSNVNWVAEMLQFNDTYDTSFFMGLERDGVPLKFASWHFHTFNFASTTNLQIHERARSIKSLFAVMRTTNSESIVVDSDHFYYSGAAVIDGTTGVQTPSGSTGIDEFQTRVGGRYYPAQPIRCTNGGAEAYVELMKTMNSLGDYTRASNINYTNWTNYATYDGGRFIMAQEFENVDAMPDSISGINGEQQSDVAITIKHTGAPVNKKIDVFMQFDAILLVQTGNAVKLVQ